MKIYCYNIKYKNDSSTIEIRGDTALQAYLETGFFQRHDSSDAPTELVVDVQCTEDDILSGEAEELIKQNIESKTKYHVKNFSYTIVA